MSKVALDVENFNKDLISFCEEDGIGKFVVPESLTTQDVVEWDILNEVRLMKEFLSKDKSDPTVLKAIRNESKRLLLDMQIRILECQRICLTHKRGESIPAVFISKTPYGSITKMNVKDLHCQARLLRHGVRLLKAAMKEALYA